MSSKNDIKRKTTQTKHDLADKNLSQSSSLDLADKMKSYYKDFHTIYVKYYKYIENVASTLRRLGLSVPEQNRNAVEVALKQVKLVHDNMLAIKVKFDDIFDEYNSYLEDNNVSEYLKNKVRHIWRDMTDGIDSFLECSSEILKYGEDYEALKEMESDASKSKKPKQ